MEIKMASSRFPWIGEMVNIGHEASFGLGRFEMEMIL